MHSILVWPALAIVAGATASIPAVQDGGNRAILYWLVLPSLLVGVAAIFARFGGF